MAKTGPEGLKLALKQKPDVVVLDIMLPEKDGFTVLKELRQRHRDMPVLVITARNFEADVLKGFDLGADDYLTKPFGIKECRAREAHGAARAAGARSRAPTIYKSATSRCASSARRVKEDNRGLSYKIRLLRTDRAPRPHGSREERWGDLGCGLGPRHHPYRRPPFKPALKARSRIRAAVHLAGQKSAQVRGA